ncbi:hypothetical protein [Enterococcus sp. AZ103]|uniref:hypothetical protein n=1 Tax=Enterococcus sp. AZ103 TaxID=2774628 RepID=UPI003F271E12
MKLTRKELELEFRNFCSLVGWCIFKLVPNVKNKKQLQSVVFDPDGNKIDVIITESGRYIKLLGNKQYEEINQKKMLDDCKA